MGFDVVFTGLSKRNGAKLRESFCPPAASHSRPRQAGAYQNSPFFLHKSVCIQELQECIFVQERLHEKWQENVFLHPGNPLNASNFVAVMAAIGLGGGGGAAGGGGAGGGNGGGNNPYGYMSGLECLQKQLQEKKVRL